MAIDIREIELTEEQKHRIAELAEQTGQSWRDVLHEQLATFSDPAASDRLAAYADPYIRDPEKRMAYFREWIAQQTSHNPHFDDSRESIYFGRD